MFNGIALNGRGANPCFAFDKAAVGLDNSRPFPWGSRTGLGRKVNLLADRIQNRYLRLFTSRCCGYTTLSKGVIGPSGLNGAVNVYHPTFT